MQILNDNFVNFKANIKFLDGKKFGKCCLDNYFYCSYPTSPLTKSMAIGDKFCTFKIRSCTGGGIIGKEGALGFHFYDATKNIEKVSNYFKNIVEENVFEPISALLIGSKDIPSAPNSVRLYNEVAKQTKKIVTPSEFKTFADGFAEADIAYEKVKDTWFVNAFRLQDKFFYTKHLEIESVNDLKSMFKSIKIAPQDRLFIGEKEVLASEHPELFLR